MTLVWKVRHCSVVKDCGLHAICNCCGRCRGRACQCAASLRTQLLARSRHLALRVCVCVSKQRFVRSTVYCVGCEDVPLAGDCIWGPKRCLQVSDIRDIACHVFLWKHQGTQAPTLRTVFAIQTMMLSRVLSGAVAPSSRHR